MTDLTVTLPEPAGETFDGSDWDVNGRYVSASRNDSDGWEVRIQVTEGVLEDPHIDLAVNVDLTLPPDDMERVCLAGLAAVREARYRAKADEIGCDFTPACPAGDVHMRECLGAYRTQAEVDAGTVPDPEELERRQKDQAFHDAYMRAGGGAS